MSYQVFSSEPSLSPARRPMLTLMAVLLGACATGGADSNVDDQLNVNAGELSLPQQVCGTNSYVGDDGCACLPGFERASADAEDTSCVRSTVLAGCHLFAQDSAHTYLGPVSGCQATNSICNKYGVYGSEYSSRSVFNEHGTYGTKYGTYSAFNDNTTTPPQLICDGTVVGCLTTNAQACSGYQMDPTSLCTCD